MSGVTAKANRTGANESIPAWLCALGAYLARDRDLDARVPNADPGRIGPRVHHMFLLRDLARLFRHYGCGAYWTWLTGDVDIFSFDLEFRGERPPINPTAEEESAALSAARDFLAPTPTYPLPATPQQRDELRELRGRASRAVADRFRQLTDGAASADQYVTLNQVAALVNRTKKTLQRIVNDQKRACPSPDVEGGGGKPNEWKWLRLRPWLESTFNRKLPEQFPSLSSR
jgi:hypothetical protein